MIKPKPQQGFFIAGTDTEVGKTYTACKILDAWNAEGASTLGFKPVASGAEQTPDGLRNEDALLLQQHASLTLPYETINPFVFEPPIAPHIAAHQQNVRLSTDALMQATQPVLNTPADVVIVEGAGGWLTPLNETETLADYAKALGFPVILVVGMKLGCINHTLLTVAKMQQDGVQLAGWIANCMGDMLLQTENIQTLEARIEAPRLDTRNLATLDATRLLMRAPHIGSLSP